MQKIKLFLILILLFSTSLKSQITKGNWMVGGSGIYSMQTQTTSNRDIKATSFNLAPNIGFLLINKLALGLKLNYGSTKIDDSYTILKQSTFSVGPFARYYLLNTENRINCLVETGYLYQTYLSSSPTENDSFIRFAAGPVIYFNSSVGLELLLNYQKYNINSVSTTNVKSLFISLGFQIHLEKEETKN